MRNLLHSQTEIVIMKFFKVYFLIALVSFGCKETSQKTNAMKGVSLVNSKFDCFVDGDIPEYLKKIQDSIKYVDLQIRVDSSFGKKIHEMKYIPGGIFKMGAVGDLALEREFPKHPVAVDGFYMDAREVTNADFREFVEATGYKTIAERPVDWEELKKQVPPGTPKPEDDVLQPGSLVFTPKPGITDLTNIAQWWEWVNHANWRQPNGPGSDIVGKEDHPVVHIALADAKAYAKWAGKRLPTEAEWEWAARGGLEDPIYPWGDCDVNDSPYKANFFQGAFPSKNTVSDKYEGTAPVGSFKPNGYGLHDMAGNVWEITSDWFDENYYKTLSTTETIFNPSGSSRSYFEGGPYAEHSVIKGGSFLCNDSYCASYRVSARMPLELNAAMNHLGFRCVIDIPNN
jgi:sulfatase modifying factor 1